MSWTPSLFGTLPFWTCDSCTTMKDKSCHIIHDVRAALSRTQIRVIPGDTTKAQFPAQVEALEPIFSTVERCCQWSGLNQQGKDDAA